MVSLSGCFFSSGGAELAACAPFPGLCSELGIRARFDLECDQIGSANPLAAPIDRLNLFLKNLVETIRPADRHDSPAE
jgi:hypothetical protein